MFTQYQIFCPENVHISSITHSKHGVLIYLDIYTYVTTVSEKKEAMNLKETLEKHMHLVEAI